MKLLDISQTTITYHGKPIIEEGPITFEEHLRKELFKDIEPIQGRSLIDEIYDPTCVKTMSRTYRYYSDAAAMAEKNYDPNNERIRVFNDEGDNIACIEIGGSIGGRESTANDIMKHLTGLERCQVCGSFHKKEERCETW